MIASVRQEEIELGLHRDYVVLDVQTTGLGLNNLILRASHMVVRNGEIAAVSTRLLDWTRTEPWPPKARLEKRVEQTQPYHGISVEDLRLKGDDPVEVLAEYRELIQNQLPCDLLVGHGLYWFEKPLFEKHFRYFLQDPTFKWPENQSFDLGLFEKANQLGDVPIEGETQDQFNERVHQLSSAGVSFKRQVCLSVRGVTVPVPQNDPCYPLYADRELYEYWHRLLVDSSRVELANSVSPTHPEVVNDGWDLATSDGEMMTEEQMLKIRHYEGYEESLVGLTKKDAARRIALHDPNARWRNEPASYWQQRQLEKFGVWERGLTKGQAKARADRIFAWIRDNPDSRFYPEVDW